MTTGQYLIPVTKRIGSKLGLSRTRLYRSWAGMMSRCLNPKNRKFATYSKKGVCKRWLSFSNFAEDMGHPAQGQTLDRIDNSKGYSPENCRWATQVQQQNNRSNTRYYTAFGETKALGLWARDPRCVVSQRILNGRHRYGWLAEDALTVPLHAWYTGKPNGRGRSKCAIIPATQKPHSASFATGETA